jgi:S-adenosylmethionine-diacylglycerol 3-amino-3-carboxypropyl transferase
MSTDTKSIQFAVVREDPRLEIILAGDRSVTRALLVGSGGCTALAMAYEAPHVSIAVVDPNPSQIELTRKKFGALSTGSFTSIKKLFNIGNSDSKGLCQNGNFESLFRLLKTFINEFIMSEKEIEILLTNSDSGSPLLQRLISHKYWPVAFELYFSDTILNAMFGPEATQYAEKNSYPPYFRRVIERGLSSPGRAQNYFLHHIFLGRYVDDEEAWPLYLQAAAARGKLNAEPVYLNQSIESVDDFSHYRLVGLSNIFDWMAPAAVEKLALRLDEELQVGAGIVIRQLNNFRDLKGLFKNFKFNETLENKFSEEDRSLFYCRFNVGVKTR